MTIWYYDSRQNLLHFVTWLTIKDTSRPKYSRQQVGGWGTPFRKLFFFGGGPGVSQVTIISVHLVVHDCVNKHCDAILCQNLKQRKNKTISSL